VRDATTERSESFDRSDLMSRPVGVLNRGGWANPDVLLVERSAGGLVVVKDFAPRGRWIRSFFGRWITSREARIYRILEGAPAVPRLLARLDSYALVLEYRPGVLLSRSLAGSLPPGFLDELRAAVELMHARGVVHLDLRHRSNVLAGEDGHPVLIDFASSLSFRPGGALHRTLGSLLARVDQAALGKWEARLGPGAVPQSSPAGGRADRRPM
jgi:serine/threonine protein kinase